MTTLITGGTGKTGLAIAKLLYQAGHPIIIASRSGKAPEPFNAVAFDWMDGSTHLNPFNSDANIEKLYIVAPQVLDSFHYVKPFIDLAVSKGVNRFVAVTSTQSEPGDIPWGKTHEYLLDLGVDYVVLRPGWFIENFGTQFLKSIKEHNVIFSSAEDGRIPFISVQDIAQAGFEALVAEKCPNRDYILVGPELFTYEDVAKLFSTLLGREITHKRYSIEQQIQIYGPIMGTEFATYLVNLDHSVAEGKEEKYFYEADERKFPAKHTLLEYIQANRDLWM